MRSLNIGLQTTITILVSLVLVGLTGVTVKAQEADASWLGEYFNDTGLRGESTLVREDAAINFNWGNNSPAPGVIDPNTFSVRWTGTITVPAGLYQFTTYTDDGVRLWVNDQSLIDDWQIHDAQAATGFITLPAGPADVRMEYFENTGAALASLTWTQIAPVGQPQPTPVATPVQAPQVPSPATSPVTTTVTASEVVSGTVFNAATLNVRSGPGTQYPSVTTLNLGQIVELVGRDVTGGWVQVQLADGSIGWVNGSFLVSNSLLTNLPIASATPLADLSVVTSTVATTGTGGLATGTVTNANRLNVRTGPGLNFNQFATLAQNQAVTLEGRNADSTWLQVRLPSGQLGWVSSLYITPNLNITNLPVIR